MTRQKISNLLAKKHVRQIVWVCLASCFAFVVPLSNAESSADLSATEAEFVAKLDATNDVIAQFDQQITDSRGFVVEQSAGTMRISKPYFRWEVLSPFAQTIVADERMIRIYDPDLEQVTERLFEGEAGQASYDTPLALLTKDGGDFVADFVVTQQPLEGDLNQYVLTPKATDALFARLEILFDQSALYALIIVDQAGQRTLVRFSEFAVGQVIQSDEFQLDLPPDVDIVRG